MHLPTHLVFQPDYELSGVWALALNPFVYVHAFGAPFLTTTFILTLMNFVKWRWVKTQTATKNSKLKVPEANARQIILLPVN